MPRADIEDAGMKPWINGLLGLAVAAIIIAPPAIRFRVLYDHHKRLREVASGKFYRAGQLTAEGMQDAVRELGIRTVINVQDEVPDPQMEKTFWDRSTVSEKNLCKQLGVRYVHLAIDPGTASKDVANYLGVLDNPAAYPILLHCRAGLHRTGVLTAVYRMEYEGWSHEAAFNELQGNGFGDRYFRDECTAANTYVQCFVLDYRRRSDAERAVAAQKAAGLADVHQ